VAAADILLGNDAAAQAGVDALTRDFAEDPELAGMLGKLGNISWQHEKYDWSRQLYQRARQLYQRTVETYPDSNDVIVMKSRVEKIRADIKLGDDANVPADINDLIADFNDHPALPETVFEIGEQYYYKAFEDPKKCRKVKSEESLHKSKDIWERIIAQWPGSKSIGLKHAQYFTAVCYRRIGEYEKALNYYQQVVDNWPDYQYAWSAQCLVGSCYKRLRDLGKLPESVANPKIEQAYKAVLEKYPDSAAVPSASLKLGHLNLEMSRNIDAAQYFELFLATANPNDPRIKSVEARLEELKGEEK